MSLLLPLASLLLGGSQAQNPAYSLHVQKKVVVQEGLCVFVPCTFSSPEKAWNIFGSAYGYWYKVGTKAYNPVATNDKAKAVQLSTRERFQLVGDPNIKNCSLLIRDAKKGDSAGYFFRIEKRFEKFNFMSGFFLEVVALTQEPDVFLPDTLEPGQPVTVFCMFNMALQQCSAPSFSWEGTVTSLYETIQHTSYFSVLSFTPEPRHHDTELTCRVVFDKTGGSTRRTVRLTVAYAPKDVIISVFHDSMPEYQGSISHLEVQQGQALRLLCAAESQPPALLSWVLEDRVLAWSSVLGPRNLVLELPGVRAGDSGRYTCRAENRLGSLHRTVSLSVLYPPQDLRVTVSQANRTALEVLRNGTTLPVLEGQSLRLVCVAHSNPTASLSWDWSTLALSPSLLSDPGVLEFPSVQSDHEGEISCAAQNSLGAQRISLRLSVHYPPQMPASSCSWEAEGLRCSCSSQGHPAPSLHWRLGEGLLEGNSSNASFVITSTSRGSWANSSLTLHGELSASLRFSCEAQNIHGAQRATVLLLPDKGSSTAFSSGVFLGLGTAALFALVLCLMLIIMKTLFKKRTQGETSRRKISRGSTILDYINVVPKSRSLARNQKAKPNTPSSTPCPDTQSPKLKNQEGLRLVSLNCPDSLSISSAPCSENSPEELHYASVNFWNCRQWGAQNPTDSNSDYAEVRLH